MGTLRILCHSQAWLALALPGLLLVGNQGCSSGSDNSSSQINPAPEGGAGTSTNGTSSGSSGSSAGSGPQAGTGGQAGSAGGSSGAAGSVAGAGMSGSAGSAGSQAGGGGSMTNLPDSAHGALLWQGFHHEWLRTVVGFRVPHRISLLDSYLSDESFSLLPTGSEQAQAMFHFGQDTGVDGNYMKPIGYLAGVASPGLAVLRGEQELTFSDQGDGGMYPKAISDLQQTISVDLQQAALAYGQLSSYTMVLRGFALQLKCDDSKQPPSEPCNSNGMWPYHWHVGVADCQIANGKLSCPLKVQISRAWTPNKGGISGLEEKPFNQVLDFQLRVMYTVLGANSDAAHFVAPTSMTASGLGHDSSPQLVSQQVMGVGNQSYAYAVSALRGFGFTFSPSETGDKFNHLGRYIGSLLFQIRDQGYDPASGLLNHQASMQVWMPDTVAQSKVDYTMDSLVIQLQGAPGWAPPTKEVQGSLCSNSQDAPFFSTWKKCSDADKGPEQNQQSVPVMMP
jgi:hypothetical protein